MRRFRLKSLFPQVPIHGHNPYVKLKGISGRYSIISIGFFFKYFLIKAFLTFTCKIEIKKEKNTHTRTHAHIYSTNKRMQS